MIILRVNPDINKPDNFVINLRGSFLEMKLLLKLLKEVFIEDSVLILFSNFLNLVMKW